MTTTWLRPSIPNNANQSSTGSTSTCDTILRDIPSPSDVDDEESDDDGDNNDWEDDEENPLDMDILDAPTKSAKAKTVADVWFEQDIFKQALQDENDDEEFELERKLSSLRSDGVPIRGKSLESLLRNEQGAIT